MPVFSEDLLLGVNTVYLHSRTHLKELPIMVADGGVWHSSVYVEDYMLAHQL